MVNDPLVFNFYLKKLKPINFQSHGGAALAKTAAEAGKGVGKGAAVKGAEDKKEDTPAEVRAKINKKKLEQIENKEKATKEKKAADEKKEGEDAEKAEEDEQQAEIDKASADSENAGELDGLKKFLQSMSKIIIGLLFVLMIPIVPFVMITFYAFKNLGVFIEIHMNRL